MDNFENIYSEAVEMLKKGHSKAEVLERFGEFGNELSPLLDISSALLLMPKNPAPEPAMQRKYVSLKAKGFWLTWVHISKFAGVSMSMILLLSVFATTGYAALKSSPGGSLFSLKLAVEKLQLILASNQDAKANIQIAIAEQRLSDAKEIFNNPKSNVVQKNAALTQLAYQTSNAVAEVGSVTKSDLTSGKNPVLLSSLDNITEQQKTLLKDIKPDGEIKTAAQSAQLALDANSVKISEIKKSVVTASNDEILVSLSANPNSVVVLGFISQITKDQITVEKTTFTLTPQTVIKDTGDKALKSGDLNEKSKVNVIGVKNDNGIIAQQVLVTEQTAEPKPEVKGASTEHTDSASDKATASVPSLKKENFNSQGAGQTGQAISKPLPNDPNQAIGSVIFESPSGQ